MAKTPDERRADALPVPLAGPDGGDMPVLLATCAMCFRVHAVPEPVVRSLTGMARCGCGGGLYALRLDTDMNDGWAYRSRDSLDS